MRTVVYSLWHLETGSRKVVRQTALRVLHIDDDPVILLLIEDMLGRLGQLDVHYETARDLGEGLDLLAAQPFDVILLDLTLPGTSGMQVFEEVRAQAASTPIIPLSATAEPSLVQTLLAAGAIQFLSKTEVTPERLGAALLDATSCRSAHR